MIVSYQVSRQLIVRSQDVTDAGYCVTRRDSAQRTGMVISWVRVRVRVRFAGLGATHRHGHQLLVNHDPCQSGWARGGVKFVR